MLSSELYLQFNSLCHELQNWISGWNIFLSNFFMNKFHQGNNVTVKTFRITIQFLDDCLMSFHGDLKANFSSILMIVLSVWDSWFYFLVTLYSNLLLVFIWISPSVTNLWVWTWRNWRRKLEEKRNLIEIMKKGKELQFILNLKKVLKIEANKMDIKLCKE